MESNLHSVRTRLTSVIAASVGAAALAVVPFAAPAGAASGKSTINVGVIADISAGPTGQASQDVPNTVNAWAKWTNAHGGINGHRIKFIIKDDAVDSAKAQAAAQTLVQSDHVVAIMDASSINSSWASYVQGAKVPVISLDESASGDTYEVNPGFFANGTTVLGILYGHVAMAKAAGGTVFGGIYCTEVAQCATAVQIWKNDTALIPGIKFGLAVAASSSSPNYTAQCLAMKQAGVDALFPIVRPTTTADNCAAQGYHPIYIGSQGTLTLSAASDPNLNGAVQNQQGFPWMLDKTPAQKLFHKVERTVLAHALAPPVVSASYTGLVLLRTALAHARGTITTQAVYNGLYSLHGTTLGGLSPTPLTFTKGQPNTQRCYFIVQIEHKKWVAFNNGKPQCEPESAIHPGSLGKRGSS